MKGSACALPIFDPQFNHPAEFSAVVLDEYQIIAPHKIAVFVYYPVLINARKLLGINNIVAPKHAAGCVFC